VGLNVMNTKTTQSPKIQWVRHRFHANADDYRPMTFPPPGPYWCSGSGDDYSIVIAYLPRGVKPSSKKLWPEASEIESEDVEGITFTDRFPKPSWWKGKT
jgi:hypothetical protein